MMHRLERHLKHHVIPLLVEVDMLQQLFLVYPSGNNVPFVSLSVEYEQNQPKGP